MYQKKLADDIRCPLEYGLEIFGGKWDSRILCVLAAAAPMRYSALRKEMVNIPDVGLAASLKKLQQCGMIDRQQYAEIPPRVEYHLTEKGASVIPILQSICHWAGAYHKEDSDCIMKQCQRCDYRA